MAATSAATPHRSPTQPTAPSGSPAPSMAFTPARSSETSSDSSAVRAGASPRQNGTDGGAPWASTTRTVPGSTRRIARMSTAMLLLTHSSSCYTIIGPQMKSTGEVMGLDTFFERAFAKAQLGAGVKLPSKGTVFISIRDSDKAGLVPMARRLTEMGFDLMATRGTAARIREAGLLIRTVNKVLEGRPHCVDAIEGGEIQLVINTAAGSQSVADSFDIRRSALLNGVPITPPSQVQERRLGP